jgi:hypothetical protein
MTRRRRTATIFSGTAALETDARQNCRLIERFNLARGLGRVSQVLARDPGTLREWHVQRS